MLFRFLPERGNERVIFSMATSIGAVIATLLTQTLPRTLTLATSFFFFNDGASHEGWPLQVGTPRNKVPKLTITFDV